MIQTGLQTFTETGSGSQWLPVNHAISELPLSAAKTFKPWIGRFHVMSWALKRSARHSKGTPRKINSLNLKMMGTGRWFSFSRGVISGSMLIFRGVQGRGVCPHFLWFINLKCFEKRLLFIRGDSLNFLSGRDCHCFVPYKKNQANIVQ